MHEKIAKVENELAHYYKDYNTGVLEVDDCSLRVTSRYDTSMDWQVLEAIQEHGLKITYISGGRPYLEATVPKDD